VHDPGGSVHVLRRQPSLEEISRLHRVIIDTHKNQIFDPHNHFLPRDRLVGRDALAYTSRSFVASGPSGA
jgi:hypothetical protein